MEEQHVPDQSPVAAPTKREQPDGWRFGAELLKTVAKVAIVVFITRGYLLQPFIVEGSSMYPSFRTNDYLLVDKISYRLHAPSRGDIVVFKYPNDTSLNYVKRIIGLPGERVKLEGGQVEIFNDQHPNGFILSEPYVSPDNKTLPIIAGRSEFTVPSDSYFVLGDNREASSDSREWGNLPSYDMIGHVIVQALPIDHFAIIHHVTYPGN